MKGALASTEVGILILIVAIFIERGAHRSRQRDLEESVKVSGTAAKVLTPHFLILVSAT